MEMAVKAILGAVSIVLIAAMLIAPADAGRRKQKFKVWLQNNDTYELSQSYDDNDSGEEFPVSEADAADIAQSQYPGARVLKVRLLPSGFYAVTLKEGGNVTRVRVDARTGSIR
jgi:uncharacterized membrane protein YkoI